MKKPFLLLTLAFTAGILAAASQQPAVKRLDGSKITFLEVDATVTDVMKFAKVPGVAMAIFDNGKIAYLQSYGRRDKEKDLPMTVDTDMDAASFTKAAFAYAVMSLAGDGTLDLDKPVHQYLPRPLPEYPNYADLANDPRYKLITARMLLSHTAGFANFRWLEDDRKLKIHFAPGSRFAYSGEGLELLQFVVETITKKPLDQLMQQRVFTPLGMTRTSMVWQERFENDYAIGYDEYGRPLGPPKRTKADAAGSMVTTPRDFARFLEAVMAGQGLKKKAWEQMLSPQIAIHSKFEFPTLAPETTDENNAIRLSYGLGWGLFWTPHGKAFFKEGHNDGERNYAVCFEKPKRGLLIMTNSSNGEGIYKELLEILLKNTYTPLAWERFTPYDELPPRPPLALHKVVPVEPDILDKYVGMYGDPIKIMETIHHEGDHLTIQESVQGNTEPRQDLLPESPTQFFSPVADDVYTFELDGNGNVTRMILHTNGEDISIPRIN